MSAYKRYYQTGGNYFFTVVTYKRYPFFAEAKNVAHLKMAFSKVRKTHLFYQQAIVILPDHLHWLWRLPANDADYSTRWRLIKRYFSMTNSAIPNSRNEKKIWQRRFWEHTINSEEDWQLHMNYIHYNPIKHGLVRTAADWPHSTFHYYVEKGIYERNWGAQETMRFSTEYKGE